VLLRHFAKGRHIWADSPVHVEAIATYVTRQVPHLAAAYTELAQRTDHRRTTCHCGRCRAPSTSLRLRASWQTKRRRRLDVEELTSEAELVAQRINSYKIAVVRLVGGALRDAVEVFSRVNSTGQSMRPAQMVSALTYHTSGQESLADRLERMLELIADTGFGEVSSDAVFRAVLAITGEENVQEARWGVLAKRVKDKLLDAVEARRVELAARERRFMAKLGIPAGPDAVGEADIDTD
jgi:hypothetical protein